MIAHDNKNDSGGGAAADTAADNDDDGDMMITIIMIMKRWKRMIEVKTSWPVRAKLQEIL